MFDGIDMVDFCRDKVTPFYVISERKIISAYNGIVSNIRVQRKKVFYSLKTNYETPVLKTVKSLGAGAEVYRKSELGIALRAGFEGRDMIMDGPCKDRADLEAALEKGVSLINAESWNEIMLLDGAAKSMGVVQPMGIRVNLGPGQLPGVFNRLALRQSKPFGFNLKDLKELFSQLTKKKNVRLSCLLAHMSVPVASPRIFGRRVRLLFQLADMARGFGYPVDRIDMGGGFPSEEVNRLNLPKLLGDLPVLSLFSRAARGGIVSKVGREITRAYGACATKYGFEPELLMEPGRCLVDDAMIAVGRVIQTRGRDILGDISTVSELGYQPHFSPREIIVANKLGAPVARAHRICGPTMLPFDVIAAHARFPEMERGDILVVRNVGAYCTVSSRPHMLPRCACYFVDKEGSVQMSRRKETYEDMIRCQMEV
jgi:diaminopimelate decarboxylase